MSSERERIKAGSNRDNSIFEAGRQRGFEEAKELAAQCAEHYCDEGGSVFSLSNVAAAIRALEMKP